MADWDRLLANKARGGSFVGRGAQDETAYFEAFADDADPGTPHDAALAGAVVRAVAIARRAARRLAFGA